MPSNAVGNAALTLRWYSNRLSRMTAWELIRRARDAVVQVLWRSRKGTTTLPPMAPREHALDLAPPRLADMQVSSASRDRLLAAANRLLEGEFTVFGHSIQNLGSGVAWFRDPLTGKIGCSAGYCFAIPRWRGGQSKLIAELSRHQHLTMLAAAYRLSGDCRYAQRVAEHLRSWWEANSVLTGIHWCSGLELGIRLISWVWIRRLLADWPSVKSLFEDNPTFLVQFFHHQEYLQTFHSYGSSANNHLIGEAAGLFAASTALPLYQKSPKWRQTAARILEDEIQRQTDEQGLHRELATDYHGFVLELLLVAGVEGDAARCPLSDAFWCRLQAMMDVLASILDCKGLPPRQGDADGGIGLLLDATGFNRWSSLLATGALIFGPLSWWKDAGVPDVRTVFLASLATSRHHFGPRPPRPIALLEKAGSVILRDDSPPHPEIWCRCDHGPLGFLSTAAHGHADALAIELRHGGVEILADPGTYCYESDPGWRQYFRSTIAHNTLELGGIDQAFSGGPFLWLAQPTATAHHVQGVDGGPVASWTASHDGYVRTLGAFHYRCVTIVRGSGCLVIEDWIEAARAQGCRLAFHLGPAVNAKLMGSTAELEWTGEWGNFSGQLALPQQLVWRMHRGDNFAGWYSREFGQKSPSITLIGSGRLAPSARLVTRLLILGEDATTRRDATAETRSLSKMTLREVLR